MGSGRCRCLPLLLLAPLLLIPVRVTPAPGFPHFIATRLGPLPRNYVTEANAVNDKGTVVGMSEGTYRQAVRWEDNLTKDLGSLPDYDSTVALAVNNAGIAVGYAEQQGKARACRFVDGKVQDLGTLGKESRATAINNHGEIAGWAEVEGNVPHAVVWRNGKLVDVSPPDALQTWVSGINDRGELVGYVNPAGPGSGIFQPFLRHEGKLALLRILPGYDYVETHGINSKGEFVGAGIRKKSDDKGLPAHAFLWSNGKLQDLGTLGGVYSRAFGVNNADQVVGASFLPDRRSRAFLWQNGRMVELNRCIRSNSGWDLSEARGINNKGQIVGVGVYQEQRRAFILTPAGHS